MTEARDDDTHTAIVRQRLVDMHKEMYGAAASYDNAIVLGGYAAFLRFGPVLAATYPRNVDS